MPMPAAARDRMLGKVRESREARQAEAGINRLSSCAPPTTTKLTDLELYIFCIQPPTCIYHCGFIFRFFFHLPYDS